MDLITTHMNADFDALGSIVAARKLYPGSKILLPGSQERAVREFLSLAKDIIRFETEESCDLEGVERLVVVDTRHRSRIGVAGKLIERGVTVHLFDHHPRMKGDIRADKETFLEVGASVTILAAIIKKKKIPLSYLEATLMLLGIYEETGSLTYRSTTKMDVDMVSFLLSCGASLPAVSRYLNRELGEEELSFLMKLINATERVSVKGTSIAVVSVSGEDYSGEIGTLIQKLMEIENISVLFAIVKTPGGRIHLVGRSKLQEVDVNKVLSHFGGGGHPTAASAKIEGGDPDAVRGTLIEVLRSHIRVRVRAADMMKPPPLSVDVNEHVSRAKARLVKEGCRAALVETEKGVVGTVTIDHLANAIRQGFGHSRVKGYMSTKVVAVRVKTPLFEVKKLFLEKDPALITVMKGARLAGVIERTDVLRRVHSDFFSHRAPGEKKIVQNLEGTMAKLLPPKIFRLLKRIGRIANREGLSVFIVGGVVRDLSLGVKNLDLDIVIEGDAIRFAGLLAQRLLGTLVVHRRFGTASIFLQGGPKIDLATARKEVYEVPAALPTVEFSSLKNDLIRRDFTINAMAVSLNDENFGQLIDFFGGLSDLRQGRIRVLHDSSFIDDPTRIFRAVRFEQRFGFTIDSHTQALITHAMRREMFDKTQTQRIRDELILILKEPDPVKALVRMDELHELVFIHPKIRCSARCLELCRAVEETVGWYECSRFRKRPIDAWLMYVMALTDALDLKEMRELTAKFVFTNADTARLLSFARDRAGTLVLLGRAGRVPPSRIFAALEPLAHEVTLAIMAKAPPGKARERIVEFFSRSHGTRLAIKGDELKACGLKPGPDFKRVMEKMLHRKIDRGFKTRNDELKYAKELIGALAR